MLSKVAGSGLRVLASGKANWLYAFLMGALSHFTYLALIAILMIAGMGMPIPEDIPLLFSGYICNEKHSPIVHMPRRVDLDGDGIKETEIPRHIPRLYWMMLAGMVGVLTGDSIIFTIGRRGLGGNNFVAHHVRKVMHSKRRERVERHFARHGNLTVFAGRFMPGFRSVVFAFAGLSKMSYQRFLIIDGLAALISVPFFIYVGYHFAEDINVLLSKVERIKDIVGPVVLTIVVGLVVIWALRRRRRVPGVET